MFGKICIECYTHNLIFWSIELCTDRKYLQDELLGETKRSHILYLALINGISDLVQHIIRTEQSQLSHRLANHTSHIIKSGDLITIKFLVNNGLPANSANNKMLEYAIYSGMLDIADYLIAEGATINTMHKRLTNAMKRYPDHKW